MSSSLYFIPGLLLRTPLLDTNDQRSAEELLGLKEFRLAIFLASADFYRILESRAFNFSTLSEREKLTLEKYINRMRLRPTPFGLFSAVSLVNWGQGKTISVSNPGDVRLILEPDHSLSLLAAERRQGDALEVRYRLNPTLYRAGREYRFIKTEHGVGTRMQFVLESFELNPLTKALCRRLSGEAMSGEQIVSLLALLTGCKLAEAKEYFDFLAGAQIICPVDGVNIIGESYFFRRASAHAQLSAAWRTFVPKFRDVATIAAHISSLNQLATLLNNESAAKAPGARVQWFYANALRSAKGSLDDHHQHELETAVSALSKLSTPAQVPLMEQFVKDFSARFESQKVPLMEALDPEIGVGYGPFASHSNKSGLLKDIAFPASEDARQPMVWSGVHRLLLDKWQRLTPEDPVVRLSRTEIEALPEDGKPLPPGMAIIFRVTKEGLLIESAGGVSGTALAGRFTSLSQEIHQMVRACAAGESKANPRVVFADIGQLSDSHTDNINRRQTIYDYEITINSSSLLGREHQIFPSELLVSVRDGMVVLESSRLKQRVIPRLATAYNFRHNHLALFRFLCDLQFQGLKADLGFSAEAYFPGMDHYPRVQFEETILSAARWQIINGSATETAESLREKLALPRHIALTRFDQQLTFDLDSPADRRLFDASISAMPAFTLQEALLPGKAAPVVATRGGKPMVNQFITFLVNRNRVYEAVRYERPAPAGIKREFILGSQWLYYKLYCKASASDDMLRQRISPIIQKLSKIPSLQWFFIRYNDPGYHIRLRIKISEEHTGLVVRLFKNHFSAVVKDRLVREFQTDTYRRELERYGHGLIEPVESFFYASSHLVLSFISLDNAEGLTEQFCLHAMQAILDHLVPGQETQIMLMKKVCDNFIAEFNGGKPLKVALDTLYRERRRTLFAEFGKGLTEQPPLLERAYRFFIMQLETLSLLVQDFPPERRQQLAADLVHLHINRVYAEQQRQHELALYYCLRKYHHSLRGMATGNET